VGGSVGYCDHTQNRRPTRTLDYITFKEVWRGRKPCIVHMHVCGCVGYAIILDAQNDKLDAKERKYLFSD
jgi:hypothetical protein